MLKTFRGLVAVLHNPVRSSTHLCIWSLYSLSALPHSLPIWLRTFANKHLTVLWFEWCVYDVMIPGRWWISGVVTPARYASYLSTSSSDWLVGEAHTQHLLSASRWLAGPASSKRRHYRSMGVTAVFITCVCFSADVVALFFSLPCFPHKEPSYLSAAIQQCLVSARAPWIL